MLALPCGAGIAYNPRPAISGSTMGAIVTSKNSNRAAVYSRYSTDKQDPSSIEDQVRVCTRLIEQRGCALAAIYSDAAMSGATAARPGLRQLLAGAEAGEFDVLVVERSEERRGGKAGVRTCRSRGSPCH